MKFEHPLYEADQRELIQNIELHPSIERTDHVTVVKGSVISDEDYSTCMVYKPPVINDEMLDELPELAKKYKIAREICSETQIIKSGKTHEKSKSKSTNAKPKKANTRANKAAMASI